MISHSNAVLAGVRCELQKPKGSGNWQKPWERKCLVPLRSQRNDTGQRRDDDAAAGSPDSSSIVITCGLEEEDAPEELAL